MQVRGLVLIRLWEVPCKIQPIIIIVQVVSPSLFPEKMKIAYKRWIHVSFYVELNVIFEV